MWGLGDIWQTSSVPRCISVRVMTNTPQDINFAADTAISSRGANDVNLTDFIDAGANSLTALID
jgi:hypothetical protein